MSRWMRCLYCGSLQDEPAGVKACARCGGELAWEAESTKGAGSGYVRVQMELDQVAAPAGQVVDRHLLITLRTPAAPPPEHAASTSTHRPHLGFSAILDVSGSMSGAKLLQAKDGVRQALLSLGQGDQVALVTFASEVRSVLEPTDAVAGRPVVESALAEIHAGGMTALGAGLELGLEKAIAMAHETRLALLLSDGQANVGETDLEQLGARTLAARRRGIIVSTLGIGMDYNEALLSEIATQGGGRFYHATHPHQIGVFIAGELGEAATVVARDVEVQLNLPTGALVVPLSAAFLTRQDGPTATIAVGDIPGDLELEVTLRLTLPPQTAGSRASVSGLLSYRTPGGSVLTSPVNQVTARFQDAATFAPRDGVVVPVVERVLAQIKAADVLGVSRTMARDAGAGAEQARERVAAVSAYASLLGDKQAEEERESAERLLYGLRDGAAAKSAVFGAQAFIRKSKTKG